MEPFLRFSVASYRYIFLLRQIPYNPLLLISGIILGLYYEHLGMLGDSIDLISSASPSGILAIFLPVLIFEGNFKT